MIKFEAVTKFYKTVIGVNEINLSLKPGAYGLLGPNGSGKTTLINLLIGQLKPTLGIVRLFDCDPWSNDSVLRRIGICPTVEPLYPMIGALEWVQYLVSLHGFSRTQSRQRAEQALELVGMTGAMKRPMTTYSLGMRQRTKVAQAIAHDPELLILDEPFNGLDPVARHDMIRYLRLWIQQGKSVILASHVLHEVEAIEPSFLLISNGRLLASGDRREVRSILDSSPNSVEIRCNDARALAAELVTKDFVDSIKVSPDGDGISVIANTSKPLFDYLLEATKRLDIRIDELHSSDESMRDLFATLMKIHRGQITQYSFAGMANGK
jgi:ABC-2 type transport system ATP-binding protein